MNSSRNGVDGGYNCRVKLNQILAIVVRKEGCRGDPGDFWMYENGYLLFQGLLSSNSVCWWNNGLNGATKSLIYYGYVNPGALLVGSEPCALEILRNAWARRVLQPPPGYQIVALEDLEHCSLTPVAQTQWTPLPEAVCAVVLRLSSQGRPAGLETIRESLMLAFPHVSPPSEHALYDTLAQLTKERKLYNTSSGYFIVTPERRRSRSQSRGRKREENGTDPIPNKTMLMTTDEAMVMVHGDMATIRDGNVTHQCIQTNLADVICGGNASDKVLYPRTKRRSASFPSPRSPDRRGSFRLWSSNRRLRRSASTRTISKHYVDTSSSTEYPNSGDSTPTPKKESLLSRLFRRSKRSQCHIGTFSAQFPPTEWFNSKAVHLHNVGTQTAATEKETGLNIAAYLDNCEIGSSRSATLPRNHRRQLSSDVTIGTPYTASRENSPITRYSNSYTTSTLPKKQSYRCRDSLRKSSRTSLNKPSVSKTAETSIEIKPNESIDTNLSSRGSLKQPGMSSDTDPTKTSQRYTTSFSYEEPIESSTDSPVKNLSSIDNSGPSSIESHKSSKTGSSLTSGPSSLESHKTVIDRNLLDSPMSTESRNIKKHARKVSAAKNKVSPSPVIPMSHSNSFTLQVTTNQNGLNVNSKTNATTTTTINGGTAGNTKIFVQNSPVRSVITFENGQAENNPNVIVIGDGTEQTRENCDVKPAKNTNQFKQSQLSLNNSTNFESTANNDSKGEAMNNNRKLSLQLPSRDSLSYHNLIKNVSSGSHNQYNSTSNPDSPIANTFREFSKNSLFTSTPPSPTKSYDGIPMLFSGKYIKNEVDTKTSVEKSFYGLENGKALDKNVIGSEPNICYKEKTLTRENSNHQFPSLSDLSFNFTSLAAQKILKGVSINSVDTLVELNMAANVEKQNNCDVVHTDFGLF
ncbi:dentin sialophosphoprotein [Anoplophora glabripennis]|uniref:dentin sialophosphoprotein n=1 Tax=Anoplophora glabripennis TaxID=217634 RepID=UPI000874CE6A|nr:dentin sialophosphoprotein [Anoplophora glabripennis]XP_018564307.1 dentin sialophosphoprotein [Anoplophora glabripennis]